MDMYNLNFQWGGGQSPPKDWQIALTIKHLRVTTLLGTKRPCKFYPAIRAKDSSDLIK
jgi:hypothetical protein